MRVTDLISTIEQDGVLHAVMQSPPTNSPVGPLAEALADVVHTFEAGSARVLLLSSGLPSCFSAGEMSLPRPTDEPPENGNGNGESPATGISSWDHFLSHDDMARQSLSRLLASRKPSIAAIDGAAVGVGLELAMACTWRFCTPSSRLSLPGVRRGLLPSAGGTQRLPRLVGGSRALDLMLTGREIRGEEALRIGLADRLVYRDVIDEALAMALSIAAMPQSVVALLIGCVEAAFELPPHLGASVERAAMVSLLDGEG